MIDWMLSTQSDAARLPALFWQQRWLGVGWAVVLAFCTVWLVGRFSQGRAIKIVLATLAATCALWPGPGGAGYWLGLAFQAPSVTTVLLCALLTVRMLSGSVGSRSWSCVWPWDVLALAVCGVALGWALLLDALGVFPASLFNWGFGATAPAWVVAGALLIRGGHKAGYSMTGVTMLALGAFLYLVLRLPSGNVFDAILDPALWLALHMALLRQWRKRAQSDQP